MTDQNTLFKEIQNEILNDMSSVLDHDSVYRRQDFDPNYFVGFHRSVGNNAYIVWTLSLLVPIKSFDSELRLPRDSNGFTLDPEISDKRLWVISPYIVDRLKILVLPLSIDEIISALK